MTSYQSTRVPVKRAGGIVLLGLLVVLGAGFGVEVLVDSGPPADTEPPPAGLPADEGPTATPSVPTGPTPTATPPGTPPPTTTAPPTPTAPPTTEPPVPTEEPPVTTPPTGEEEAVIPLPAATTGDGTRTTEPPQDRARSWIGGNGNSTVAGENAEPTPLGDEEAV